MSETDEIITSSTKYFLQTVSKSLKVPKTGISRFRFLSDSETTPTTLIPKKGFLLISSKTNEVISLLPTKRTLKLWNPLFIKYLKRSRLKMRQETRVNAKKQKVLMKTNLEKNLY